MPSLESRDRATRLFRFLAELAKLRIRKVRDLSSYESVFWFHELPHEREVYSCAWGQIDENEPWIRVDKPFLRVPPSAPEVCNGWFDPDSIEDFSAEPTLRKTHAVLTDPHFLLDAGFTLSRS
jgi:hypothetical protein